MKNDEGAKRYHRVYSAVCDDYDICVMIDRALSDIMMQKSINRQQAMVNLMVDGLVQHTRSDVANPELVQLIHDRRLYEHVAAQFESDKKLRHMLDAVGIDRVYQIFAKQDPDAAERMIDRVDELSPRWPESEAMGEQNVKLWLLKLFADMRPRTTADVKELVRQEFGDEELSKQWARVRTAASRLGLSRGGKSGMWEMTIDIRGDYTEELVRMGVYAESSATDGLV